MDALRNPGAAERKGSSRLGVAEDHRRQGRSTFASSSANASLTQIPGREAAEHSVADFSQLTMASAMRTAISR